MNHNSNCSHHGHGENCSKEDQQKKIACEMLPYFFFILLPVTIIIVIAKIFAPSTF